MRLLFVRKCNIYITIACFGLFFVIFQMIYSYKTAKNIRKLLSTSEDVAEAENLIAMKCLNDLKNPYAKIKFKEALKKNTNNMLSVLMEYLPHCVQQPPRKFISNFVELISDILDQAEEEFEFESPWPNRTQRSNTTISNFCPELSPLLQGKINITFNGNMIFKQ